jgi:hypothetical protein
MVRLPAGALAVKPPLLPTNCRSLLSSMEMLPPVVPRVRAPELEMKLPTMLTPPGALSVMSLLAGPTGAPVV